MLVGLTPGSKDRGLHDQLTQRLSAWDGVLGTAGEEKLQAMVFAARPAKTPREYTELWYTSGFDQEAKALAELLAELTGPVSVKFWEWGTSYDVIRVTGRAKAPE